MVANGHKEEKEAVISTLPNIHDSASLEKGRFEENTLVWTTSNKQKVSFLTILVLRKTAKSH